jgi:hypothetical protein
MVSRRSTKEGPTCPRRAAPCAAMPRGERRMLDPVLAKPSFVRSTTRAAMCVQRHVWSARESRIKARSRRSSSRRRCQRALSPSPSQRPAPAHSPSWPWSSLSRCSRCCCHRSTPSLCSSSCTRSRRTRCSPSSSPGCCGRPRRLGRRSPRESLPVQPQQQQRMLVSTQSNITPRRPPRSDFLSFICFAVAAVPVGTSGGSASCRGSAGTRTGTTPAMCLGTVQRCPCTRTCQC